VGHATQDDPSQRGRVEGQTQVVLVLSRTLLDGQVIAMVEVVPDTATGAVEIG